MEVNEIYCIGSNKFGQAGAGKKYHNQSFATFNKMIFPVFVKQVVCGSHHSGLLTLEGFVYMMGSNINGALGCPSSTVNYSYSPILVENVRDVSKICSGHYHMCAISEGRLYSWGKGVDGQLGTGKLNNCSIPSIIDSFGEDVQDVSCGLNHTLVKLNNQKCYAFGNGIYGQLGTGSNKNSHHPILCKIENVSQIAAGENFSLFLKQGLVYGVGDNSSGQISSQLKKKYTMQLIEIPIKNATAIRASKFAAAVLEDKHIYVWGLKQCQEPISLDTGDDDCIMDIQLGGNIIYCLNSQGELYLWKPLGHGLRNSVKHHQLKDKTVLGFSVGQTHSLVIGDIADTVPIQQKPLKILANINTQSQKEFSKGKVGQNRKQEAKQEQKQQSKNEEEKQNEFESISSQHLSRTPSSIMREPHNFIKGENKQQNINITQFVKEKVPIIKKMGRNKKQQIDMSECMKKIDEIIKMLNKNNKLQQIQSTICQISRKSIKSNLDKSIIYNYEEGKQNKFQQKNLKQNKQLIMELREKDVKISQLQEKLSRKQIEIQSQRQLINLLRKITSQNQ